MYRQYGQLRDFLEKVNQPVYFAEDHGEIAKLLPSNTKMRITNLDYHHDFWEYKGGLDCATWLSYLRKEKMCRLSIDWRRLFKKEGDMFNNLDEALIRDSVMDFDGVFDRKYDLIFVCQSYTFSPPHMGHYFKKLIDVCSNSIISEDSPPIYLTYTEECERLKESSGDDIYFVNGEESDGFLDDLLDNEIKLINNFSALTLIGDCDPEYRR
jgi:hypothetical protein